MGSDLTSWRQGCSVLAHTARGERFAQTYPAPTPSESRTIRLERTRGRCHHCQLGIQRYCLHPGVHHSEPLLPGQSALSHGRHSRHTVDRPIWLRLDGTTATDHRRQRRGSVLVSAPSSLSTTESPLVRPEDFEEAALVLVRLRLHVGVPDYPGLHVPLAQRGVYTLSGVDEGHWCQGRDPYQHLWRFAQQRGSGYPQLQFRLAIRRYICVFVS